MNNSLSILFYIKKSKADSLGKANIYLRITVDGKRAEFSIRRKITPARWSNETGLAKGNSSETQELNRYISSIKNKLYQCEQRFIDKGIPITSKKLRDALLEKETKFKMLIEEFENHNNQVEKLIGIDFAPNTLIRYKTTLNHLKKFVLNEYNIKDIALNQIDNVFINRLEYYFKTSENCGHNTTFKYISNLKKIVRIAYNNGWIKKDPFVHYKTKYKTVDREFLTEQEIQTLIEKDFRIERLNQVKDIFIFCYYTGLAYIDVKKLVNSHIVLGIDGEYWINTKRTKTDSKINIPLLPSAYNIIKKYQNFSEIIDDDKVLPVLSNQKMNAYLKEIAVICEINKNLTFHLARHTFATTVTLTNGVSIESVSKMLGHKSLRTTQHYAKILDKKVSEDMNALRIKMSGVKQTNSNKSIK
ncbi:site-specific integrase [Mariniflexile gromovii]|uniref:Site-specific integrase n=1 Tax=Mariniflexile gromovii TaxID=362523 RepID=A0ABS4BQ09_9FLAO|nr:site-specific integrase [Mariniflexile gromovii]MBP0902656.1 site-specific integrase [Mariniflexile gromovii]